MAWRCLFSEKVAGKLERLFCKKEFYFSILGIVLILFLSANDGMGNIGDSVLSAVLLSSYDAGFLIAFSLATFSYGTAFEQLNSVEKSKHFLKIQVIFRTFRS